MRSTEIENGITGRCPVCAAEVSGRPDVETDEIVTCPECRSALAVASLTSGRLVLEVAPQAEEDWGE